MALLLLLSFSWRKEAALKSRWRQPAATETKSLSSDLPVLQQLNRNPAPTPQGPSELSRGFGQPSKLSDPSSMSGTSTKGTSETISRWWPGAKVIETRDLLPVDGLTTRVTLLESAHFPYPVYVEEQLNALDVSDEEGVVKRFEAVASHVLFKLRPGRSLDDIQALVQTLPAHARPHPSAESLYFLDLVELKLDGIKQAQNVLSQYPEFFEYVEPDAIVRAAATTPNDPRFSPEQWGLQNTGQGGGTSDVDIDAPEAWDIRREATNVVVAVVDSGVRYTHEDLAANMWRNPGEIPGNGIDDDGNGFVDDVYGINAIDHTGDPNDDVPDPVLGVGGHGTSVAGVLGAVGNNGRGIAGVAWKVQIMALKWFNIHGAGALSDAIQCLDYARSKGASIVNASWQQGGLLSGTVNQSMMDALDRLRKQGILFVSSAGNDGANNDLVAHYPSNYPFDNMVAVAAGNRTGSLSRQSNFGERLVDVVAPGEDVLSTGSKSDTDYLVVSGTSFAAPHVTGMLALLKAQFPNADYRGLIDRLLAGVDRRDRLVGKVRTGGFVNLMNSIRLASVGQFPEITSMNLNGQTVSSQDEISLLQGTNFILTATATGSPAISYSWRKDGKLIQGATGPTYSLSSFATGDIGEYQMIATNASGAATFSLRILGVVSKPEVATAVNATNRTFLCSGNALWDKQTIVTRDGLSAGASGAIAGRQSTVAATTLVGPGKMSFVWKVSSERNNDTLDFLIDGVKIDAISGEVDWTRKEFQLSAGSHEVRWRYVKDASLSKGADKGYLDLFDFQSAAKLAPTITVQPVTQTVVEGGNVFLSVVAEGSVPFRYQWMKDGKSIANGQSNRLDLLSVNKTAEGRYAVVVSNEVGFVTSSTAHLTVTPVALAPRITTQPGSVAAEEGGSIRLSVVASGTPPLRYQWQKAGVALLEQTNAVLTLGNLRTVDGGNYDVVVSNAAGQEKSQSVTLSVVQLQLAPSITKQPSGTTVEEGQPFELALEVKGLGPFNYQWIRDGKVLTSDTGPELVRDHSQSVDAGSYQVRVSSPFGVTLSAQASVRVTASSPSLGKAVNDTNFIWSTYGDAPWFRQSKQSADGVDALQSGGITNLQFSGLSTEVTGPGQVSFWWKVSSEFGYDTLSFYVDGDFADSISGEHDWEEVIWNVEDGAHVLVWLYEKDEVNSEGNDAGWIDQFGFVSFNTESPVIARHPSDQIGILGGQVTFESEALGSPPFRYQWYRGDVLLAGATSNTLTLSGLTLSDEGPYYLSVSNRFGTAVSRDAFLSVFNASEATDFALDQPGLSWTNFNYTPWYPEADTTYSGDSALRSGTVGDQGVAWIGTAVEGPGILYYAWKVSSEEDYDFLEFLLDRELYSYVSGEVDWEENSVIIPPGVHFIDWVYFKDEILSSGDDAGWLDQVSFIPLDDFSYWQNLYFTPEELADPEISGPDADADKDGILNQVEYGFGLDPWEPDNQGLPVASVELSGQKRKLIVDYTRRTDVLSAQYDIQTSKDLRVWTSLDPSEWTEEVTELTEGLEQVRTTLLGDISSKENRYYRVGFTLVQASTQSKATPKGVLVKKTVQRR